MPCSASLPSMTIGACPSSVVTSPPMRRSGSAMRSIGRVRSDSSPVSSNRPCWPASTPASSRINVPAFAQSIGPPGARNPRNPTPCTRSSSSPSSSTSTPSARIALTVAIVSSERPKPLTCVSPSPIPPSSTERCEIDLSPGTATCPTTATAGSTFMRLSRSFVP